MADSIAITQTRTKQQARDSAALRFDFHIHTKYSFDCSNTLEDIVKRCRQKGINGVNIADHGTVEGGLRLKAMAAFPIIVSEEILTPNGEIMGMFLRETIPSNIPVEEAINRIKAQGGLVCLPHPFDTYRNFKMEPEKMDALASQIDVIEVFNARSLRKSCSTKAQDFASKHKLPGTAGSDAHSINEIGSTWVEIADFHTKEEFLEALRFAKIHGRTVSWLYRFSAKMARILKDGKGQHPRRQQ